MYRVYATDPHARINLWNSPGPRHCSANSRLKSSCSTRCCSQCLVLPTFITEMKSAMGDNFLSLRSQGCRTDAVEPLAARRIFRGKSAAAFNLRSRSTLNYIITNRQRGEPPEKSLLVALVDAAGHRHAEKFQAFSRGSLEFLYPTPQGSRLSSPVRRRDHSGSSKSLAFAQSGRI